MKQAWQLVLAITFVIIIFFLQNFAPSLSEVNFLSKLPVRLPYKWHRIIPVSIGIATIFVVWLIWNEISLLLAFTPGFIKLTLFDPVGITIVFILSLSWYFYKKHKWWSAAAAIIALAVFASHINIPKYSLSQAGFDVDQRVREETRINNFQDIIPLAVKRIAYNKWYFEFQYYASFFVSLINIDKFISPSEQGATVARNLWERGFPDIFFWEIPLFFLIAANRNKRFKQITYIGFVALLLTASIPYYYHFIAHELTWRDNRPFVEYGIIQSIGKNYSPGPITVTAVLDNLENYYLFEYGQLPNRNEITFRHFDLSLEASSSGLFIGFPGEFLGNRMHTNNNDFSIQELPKYMHVIDSFTFPTHVSFGNGDAIWTVKVD